MNSDEFKLAMGRFPSGVTIVTTVDLDGKKCGFTASAFSSLSLDPPLILVCLANSADCSVDPLLKCCRSRSTHVDRAGDHCGGRRYEQRHVFDRSGADGY